MPHRIHITENKTVSFPRTPVFFTTIDLEKWCCSQLYRTYSGGARSLPLPVSMPAMTCPGTPLRVCAEAVLRSVVFFLSEYPDTVRIDLLCDSEECAAFYREQLKALLI